MTVLVTGSEGLIGKAVCSALSAQDKLVVGVDLVTGGDILDADALADSAQGCEAIIHCAALLGYPGQSASQIMEVNLQGTWNVLCAALSARIDQVVFLSSVDVLGVFKGERIPDFLPLDESHACYPRTPYAMSKHLAEQMCQHFALTQNKTIVALRPPGVWVAPSTYEWIVRERSQRPSFEWDPFWEYGAFIDLRDLTSACLAALRLTTIGYHAVFVSADDITTSGMNSAQLCKRLHGEVDWRGGSDFDENPFRTLLGNQNAKQLLGWKPAHRWADFVAANRT